MKERTLVSPGSFQANLPLGPVDFKQHTQAGNAKYIGCSGAGKTCDIHEEAEKLIVLMETQLIGIAGFEGKEAVSHSGRVEGPKVVSRCPMQPAIGTSRTTPALRAWKATWKWLGKLLHHKPCAGEAEAIIRRILKHGHGLGKGGDDEQFTK